MRGIQFNSIEFIPQVAYIDKLNVTQPHLVKLSKGVIPPQDINVSADKKK